MEPNTIERFMIDDEALQLEIIDRVMQGNFGDNPDRAVHALGTINATDGKEVPLFLRHAADAILMDAYDHVVLIKRKHNPGAGLWALPGGFINPCTGRDGAIVVEKAAAAALREAMEETDASEELLAKAQIIAVGNRNYDRPFDIRVAWAGMPDSDIKKADYFAVSTQGFCVYTTEDLSKVLFKAQDDAESVRVDKISNLREEEFGIADHLPMIKAAQAVAASLKPVKPEQKTGPAGVANPALA